MTLLQRRPLRGSGQPNEVRLRFNEKAARLSDTKPNGKQVPASDRIAVRGYSGKRNRS
jgi:hypothetical protein